MKSIVETNVRVRFDECDYYMHVNNSVYQNYMDVGLGDFLRQFCPDLRELKFMIHKVHSSVDYMEAAEFEDDLVIKTFISGMGNTSVTFTHQIFKGEKLIVHGKIIFVTLDLKTGEKSSVPEEMRQLYKP
ncbi:MAG: acyl-CoA thioesterase [Gammaproteobacteria bacterium]|nr:MAG: acyl-CoA thioesterase [Gammaproteobacteria bacterium]